KADLLANSATDIIVADLKQEIKAGSSPTPSGIALYVPTSNANMVPMTSGTPTPTTYAASSPNPNTVNLIRRSVRSDAIAVPGVASRASAVNSTTDPSLNSRAV